MSAFNHFFTMGGYANYVWSAYSIVFLGIFFSIFFPVIKHAQLLNQLKNKPRKIRVLNKPKIEKIIQAHPKETVADF